MTLTLKIIIGVAVASIVGLVCMQFIDMGSANQVVENTTDVVKNTISISGYVVTPGKYVFDEEATMQDLIDKAGGLKDKADVRCFIPTAKVAKNIDYYIPPRYDPSDICGNEEIKKVNINTFTNPEALTYIQDIGTAISESIIKYREENGNYETLEAIMDIDGIGTATYTRLKNYIMLKD